jgi:hypothetical protein
LRTLNFLSGTFLSGAVKQRYFTQQQESIMEMKRINAGKLRAIGYAPKERVLRVELEDGSAIDYSGVGLEVWRKLSTSGAAWSYYRDNIEEEFSGRRSAVRAQSNRQALDDLFKSSGDDVA